MFKYFISFLILFKFMIITTYCFPDGAPVDACVKPRPNQPYHGQSRPQSPESNPFQVIASGDSYFPGSQITVTIQGSEYFKGFFIQARDVATNEWIGDWVETPNTKRHPECSAITHADPREKQQATLIWHAPHHHTGKAGKVYFTGTVLKDYSTFWSDIERFKEGFQLGLGKIESGRQTAQ